MATLKGTAVQPNFDWVKKTYGDDVWQQILAGLPDGMRADVAFVQSARNYEVSEISAVLEALADREFPNDMAAADRAFRQMGGYIAEVSLSGLYSLFIRVAKPEAIVKRIPTVVTTMFTGVTAETVAVGDRSASVVMRGLGELAYAAPRLCGWAETALAKCGADATVTEQNWQAGKIKSDELVYDARW